MIVCEVRGHHAMRQRPHPEDRATCLGDALGLVAYRGVKKTRSLEMLIPFATFHEQSRQRNGVKVWHDYEYSWAAMRLTNPAPK